MNESNVIAFWNPEAGVADPVTEVLRAGAKRLLCQAVEQERRRSFLRGMPAKWTRRGARRWYATGICRRGRF